MMQNHSNPYFLSPVSSASMTRLRSRTTSSSSISSFDSARSRAHTNELRGRTHSHGTEEKRGRSHTDVSMESISNSNVDHIISKSTELACQSVCVPKSHALKPDYTPSCLHCSCAVPFHLHYFQSRSQLTCDFI